MPSYVTHITRRFCFLFIFACLSAQTLFAQDVKPAPPPANQQAETPDDVVRINSELFQTDVMVFDKGGKFIDGLKPEQFELRVDGKPQAITFFERIKSGAVNEDAQLAAARGGATRASRDKSNGSTVVPLDRGRTIFFFVDDLHLSANDAMRMRKTLLRFVNEELGQNDVAAIASASGQVGFLQQMTDNKAVLRAAIARLNPRPSAGADGERPPMSDVQALAINHRDMQVTDYFVDAYMRENPGIRRDTAEQMVNSRAQAIVTVSDSIAANTLRSLDYLIRDSAPLPGRKILFFVSGGFAINFNGDTRDYLRRVTDSAARSSVIIYSLDVQGLATGLPDASSDQAFDVTGRLSAVNAQELSAKQEPLFTLALDTGGRALVNTNAMGLAVTKALQETSVYYLLAWRPDSVEGQGGRSAKFHRIEASVKGRPDLKVTLRRGFYDAPPTDERAHEKKSKKKPAAAETAASTKQTPEHDLLQTIKATYPRSNLPSLLSLGYVSVPNAGAQLTASLELPREALDLIAGSATNQDARVNTVMVVYDEGGHPVASLKQDISIPQAILKPDDKTEAQTPHVAYSRTVSLKPGLYQVRVATQNPESGRTGSAMQWIEIPDFKPGKLAMSSIFLGERQRSTAATEKKEAPPQAIEFSVDRRFARTSWVRFMTFIYNAGANPDTTTDVALQIQLFRDDQPVLTTPLKKVSVEGIPDHTRIPYAAELALDTFPAGRYVLQVTAIDRAAKASTTQRVNFMIE